ncbi:MAG: TRAP transporter small permease [Chloroflexi bacterium]|nr:TRAP transporter small permease [Chloroflexota bacterium]
MRRFTVFANWFNDRVVGMLGRLLAVISLALLAAMVLIITVYVVLRKFTEIRIYFVEEWTGFFVVMITYFAATYALTTRGHIIVETVVQHFPPKARRLLELVVGVVGTFIISFMLQRSLSFFLYQIENNIRSWSVMRTPMWIPTIFVPIGLTVFLLGMIGFVMQKVVEVTNPAGEKEQLSLPLIPNEKEGSI